MKLTPTVLTRSCRFNVILWACIREGIVLYDGCSWGVCIIIQVRPVLYYHPHCIIIHLAQRHRPHQPENFAACSGQSFQYIMYQSISKCGAVEDILAAARFWQWKIRSWDPCNMLIHPLLMMTDAHYMHPLHKFFVLFCCFGIGTLDDIFIVTLRCSSNPTFGITPHIIYTHLAVCNDIVYHFISLELCKIQSEIKHSPTPMWQVGVLH